MKQPEALRLADALQWPFNNQATQQEAAAELRRLHEANQVMIDALNEINSWLVCACIAAPEDMAQSFPHMQKVADAAIAKGEQA